MKTLCEDQTTTNNTLEMHHPALNNAYRLLKAEHPNYSTDSFERLYEERYKCKVIYEGNFHGKVTFNSNKDLVWFLLKYSEDDNQHTR